MKRLIFSCFFLASCAAQVPIENLHQASQSQVVAANKIRVYMLGSALTPSGIDAQLGEVEAYSCKHELWDMPASKANALSQLRLKAAEMGADALMDVTIDRSGTDAFGTDCWNAIEASGMAIKINK